MSAPIVKVTEVAGRLQRQVFDPDFLVPDEGGTIGIDSGMFPPESWGDNATSAGPPGRFRITVEWWPAGDDK